MLILLSEFFVNQRAFLRDRDDGHESTNQGTLDGLGLISDPCLCFETRWRSGAMVRCRDGNVNSLVAREK